MKLLRWIKARWTMRKFRRYAVSVCVTRRIGGNLNVQVVLRIVMAMTPEDAKAHSIKSTLQTWPNHSLHCVCITKT